MPADGRSNDIWLSQYAGTPRKFVGRDSSNSFCLAVHRRIVAVALRRERIAVGLIPMARKFFLDAISRRLNLIGPPSHAGRGRKNEATRRTLA